MKKKIAILVSAFVVIVSIGLGIDHLMSLHKVTFTLNDSVESITVYNSNKEEINQFTDNGHILLKEGEYHITPEGEAISKDDIDFTVGGEDIVIEVDPVYSKDHLDSLLKKEKASIEDAISSKYSGVFNDYNLTNHTLYAKGEWFGGLLRPEVGSTREQKDPYRIVLHKEDGKWRVIRRPEYVLTASRYEEVPIDILRDINALVQ